MLLNKTDKARNALRDHRGVLGAADRRALILCDGRRGLDELARLLGPDILRALDQLRAQGYLQASPSPPTLALRVRNAARDLLGDGDAGHAASAVAPATVPTARPAPRPGPTAPTRRSLAATKMYMLDMLQLQRSADAADLRMEVQTASGDEALVDGVLRALAFIQQQANASYAARVGERLAEVLPEAHLPRLAAMRTAPAGIAPA